MAGFSRRIPTYQDAFPSSSVSFVAPSEVSEDVQLQHPFLAAGARFQETVQENVIGALGVPSADFNVVPPGRYWWVPFWHARHNAAAARDILFEIIAPNLGNIVVIHNSRNTFGSPISANVDLTIPRPILVPSGWTLSAATSGIGAGEFITTRLCRVEYPLAESPPPF